MINDVANKMIEYYGSDKRRINHFLKVYSFASLIGKNENIDADTQKILEITALMHDIGIKVSEEKFNSSAGKYQMSEGPAIAEKFLTELGYDKNVIDRVCYIIGHHHIYTNIDGIDYQILVEADFLVNLDEEGCNAKQVKNVKDKIFKTESGKKLIDEMFLSK